ncbi:APC family permease [Nocardioides sp. CER19]|uniref:APC family permease n=1 Tax=Nocardioides sp. CER19 TaxID=3038538 RepID=UPI0024497E16|nr:APC family permease [Nocardioides sp. CER19]MDH2416119.1 APC family permease [Nocardioides sp. CER19]
MTTTDAARTPRATSSDQKLEGKLGVGGLVLTALAFNTPLATMGGFVPLVIGMGVGAATPFVYLAVMVLMLLFAVGLVHMAKHMEKPGAFYSYVTAGIGRIPGLGAGFLALISYFFIVVGVYVLGGYLWNNLFMTDFGTPSLPWWLWVIPGFLVVSALTLFNIEVSGKALVVILGLETVSVLIWEAFVFAKGGAHGVGLPVTAQLHTGSVGFAALWGIGCMMGFESIQVFRAETREPERTVPRATYLTVIFLAGFYALGSWAYLAAFGTDAALATAADPTGSFMASVAEYVSASYAKVVYFLLVTTGMAATLSLQNILARYLFAFGRDRVLPSWLGHAHPRFRSPARAAAVVFAVIGVSLVIIALVDPDVVHAYSALTGIGNIVLQILLVLTAISIIVYFRRRTDLQEGTWKTLIAPALAALGLGTVVFLDFKNRALVVGDTTLADIGLAVVLAVFLAGAVYARWLRRNRADVWERIGNQDGA